MSTPTKYEGHTPGPWVQQNKYGVFALDALGVVKNTICWTALNNNTRTEENEANARLVADAPALLAENTRLREALRTIAANTQSAQVKFVAEQALAAGKGETVPTEKCAQCGKQTEETWSCSDGVNEAIKVCSDCRGER